MTSLLHFPFYLFLINESVPSVRARPISVVDSAGCGSSPSVVCVFVHPLFRKSRVFETLVFRARAHAPTLASSLRFFSLLRFALLFVSLPPSVFVVRALSRRSVRRLSSLSRRFTFVTCSECVPPRSPLHRLSFIYTFTVFFLFFFSRSNRVEYLAIFLAVHTQGVRKIVFAIFHPLVGLPLSRCSLCGGLGILRAFF